MRTRTAIVNTDSQEARHNKDSEFTSDLGEGTNIFTERLLAKYGTESRGGGMATEGFLDISRLHFAHTQKEKWTAKWLPTVS